jgi:hypothetical protein
VLGRVLFTAAVTASTQVVVQENVARLPDGLVFVADKQLGGKGARRPCTPARAACDRSVHAAQRVWPAPVAAAAIIQRRTHPLPSSPPGLCRRARG